MTSFKFGACLIVFSSTVLFLGCEKNQPSPTSQPRVVATVNGEKITESDVDFMLERTFSDQDLMQADSGLRSKVLQSLIASRAMKQKIIQEITAEEKNEIDQAVRAYEEELFVKTYLQKYISPAPVTAEMVKKYYEEHPQEFGGEIVREFELLKSSVLNDEQRDALLASVNRIKNSKNWSAGFPEYGLQYQQGQAKSGLLDASIERAMISLKEGETSDALYIGNQIYLLRVKKIHQTPPKALANVGDEIRKKLAPMLLRESVKKATDDILNASKIEYSKD
jgi:PPIC-type PPIASE domain/SurA N-terminal domain